MFNADGIPRNWGTCQAGPSTDPLCNKSRGLIGDLHDNPHTGMFCEWRVLVRFLDLPPQTSQACGSQLLRETCNRALNVCYNITDLDKFQEEIEDKVGEDGPASW